MDEAALERAFLHRKEKELLYCALFVTGWLEVQAGNRRAVCSPLLSFPAEISVEDDYAFATVDLSRRRINFRLLERLAAAGGVGEGDDLTDLIGNEIEPDRITGQCVAAIARALEVFVPGIDHGPVRRLPAILLDAHAGAGSRRRRLNQPSLRPIA